MAEMARPEKAQPEAPREAALIEAARRRARLTIREAAKRASMSDARWRQIKEGYQIVNKQRIPVKAPADTLARMALVVGVTAEELARAGREDAAAALEEITPTTPEGRAEFNPPVDAVYAIMAALPVEAQDEVIRRLRQTSTPLEEGSGHARRAG